MSDPHGPVDPYTATPAPGEDGHGPGTHRDEAQIATPPRGVALPTSAAAAPGVAPGHDHAVTPSADVPVAAPRPSAGEIAPYPTAPAPGGETIGSSPIAGAWHPGAPAAPYSPASGSPPETRPADPGGQPHRVAPTGVTDSPPPEPAPPHTADRPGPPPWGAVDGRPAPVALSGARRRWRLVAVLAALALGLAGTAWFSTSFFRHSWLPANGTAAATPDASGTATLRGITVSLVEITDLGASPSLPGSDWSPPRGFHAWRVVLHSVSVNEDLNTCDVDVIDDQGRVFSTNVFVDSFVDGYEFSYSCGVPEPDDDIGPEQALMVLLPEDAVPVTVTVGGYTLNPDSIELPVG